MAQYPDSPRGAERLPKRYVASAISIDAIPVFNALDNGLAPASGGGAVNFLRADGTWVAPSGGGGAAWGGIAGTLGDQADLQTALNGKQVAGSYVLTGDFSWANLGGKPTTFAPSAHSHAIADVTGLQGVLDGKQAAGSYAAASHTHIIADVTGLQGALDGKQPAGSYLTAVAWGDVSGKPAFLTATNTSRILGRASAGFGEPEQLTGIQVSAMLSAFDQTTKGLVPAPVTVSGRFLKDDGTWAAPDGGAGGSDPWTWSKLAADIATTGTVLTTSGLSFTAAPNTTYIVRVVGGFTAAATTTGIAMALDIPSGVPVGTGYHLSTAAGASLGFEQIADNSTVGVTTGVRAANTLTGIEASWIIEIGATGGTVTLNFRSEVSGSAVTLKKPFGFGYRAI